MAKSSTNTKKLAAFTTSVKVEVRQPQFEPLASLSALDYARLSRGNHKVELGFVDAG